MIGVTPEGVHCSVAGEERNVTWQGSWCQLNVVSSVSARVHLISLSASVYLTSLSTT